MGWYKLEFFRDYLRLFWIHPIFLVKIYIFRWHDIEDKEICDPMEKIWVKKDLYKEIYEFLNFMDFILIFQVFSRFSGFDSFKKGGNRKEKIVGSWPT